MPVEFLSDEQASAFGRFVEDDLSRQDLERFAWLDDADLAVIAEHRGDANRLGFAVQLTSVRMVGTFLPDPLAVPWALVSFLAEQLVIDNPSAVTSYTVTREKTPYEHQWEITKRYGFRAWSDADGQADLRDFLAARAWTSAEGPTRLFERATGWLRARKILLPGVSVLARLVSQVRAEQTDRLHQRISDAVPIADRLILLGLLTVPTGSRVSELERLRTGPSRVSVAELLRQLQRLDQLEAPQV